MDCLQFGNHGIEVILYSATSPRLARLRIEKNGFKGSEVSFESLEVGFNGFFDKRRPRNIVMNRGIKKDVNKDNKK